MSADFAVQKALELKGTKGVPIDMWTWLDLFSGIAVLSVLPYLMSLDEKTFLD